MPVLTRRRAALAAVAAVVALTGAAYYAFRPVSQTAAATPPPAALLQVEPRPPRLLPGGAEMTAEQVDSYRKCQAALVKSDFVANAALRDPEAREALRGRPDAPAWLAEHVTAEYPGGGPVLRVGVAGVPPREAAALANAVAGAFLKEFNQVETQSRRQRCQGLEDVRDSLRKALDARREELQQSAAAAGVPPDRADQRALLASLYQERTGLRVELAKVGAGKDGCELADREKLLRDDLAALDGRIKSCEQADLGSTRAEVARLEAALSSVNDELIRLQVDMNSPPRVRLLALATVSEG